jgi:glutathione synthase/RimK-type ligase-like ATP-grasp enzyme
MSSHLIVVENLADWKPSFPNLMVITAKDYLAQQEYFELKNAKVINLCRSYRYLSRGYYCSLLAEARHHKVIPTVRTLRDLSSKAIYSLDIDSLDELVQKSLEKNPQPTTTLETQIFFGRGDKAALKEVARQIFATFACPLLNVTFRHQEKWQISSIKSLYLNNLSEDQINFFLEALDVYVGKRWLQAKTKQTFRYDLAILHDPKEKLAPSDAETLEKFVDIGKKMGVDVDLITKKDYPRLAEYDALFIRETTSISHHTYRFAKKAESEGMIVIDDPDSILRCTNKVYLAELLKAHNIPTPKTLILQKDHLHKLEGEIPYPVVLKIPDGSFGLGVFKANNEQEVRDITNQLFKESDIILAQEYLYTPFDWRIGILNRRAIYACQYFMFQEHWQIVRHDSSTGTHSHGTYRTFAVDKAPKEVVRLALRAAREIGDGLYGVDLKSTEKGVFVIEVNDNPNIDESVENAVLKDELYRIVIRDFIRRLDKKTQRR